MGLIKIELLSEDTPWGLFTEEQKPRIILPLWLTKPGQFAECEEEELTPNQLHCIQADHQRGVIKVTGASFLEMEQQKKTIQDQVFDSSAVEAFEFQKEIKRKRDSLKKKNIDPTIDEKEVTSFLKKRQDKLIVAIKKENKSLSFLKACREKEKGKEKPRKKVLAELEEAIYSRLSKIQTDIEDSSELKKPSLLEGQYSELIEEEVLEEAEKEYEYTKEEIDALIKKLQAQQAKS